MKKVAFYTLGCKLNYSETSTIARQFTARGFQKVEFEDTPDIFIINTCSVTENADKKCRKLVKEAQRISPDAYIAIIGCYAQLKPQEIASIEGVDAVLGASEKFQLLDLLPTFEKKVTGGQGDGGTGNGGQINGRTGEQVNGVMGGQVNGRTGEQVNGVMGGQVNGVTGEQVNGVMGEQANGRTGAQVFVQEVCHAQTFNSSYSYGDRTRTFLKVQDGCDYNCSFCTIPLARGESRSDSIANVVGKAQEIVQNTEAKEIVLTGVNTGDFGKQNGRRVERFMDLVKALDEVGGIERIRISSIEPNLLSEEIISFVAQSKRFVPHFHIPLQSGSNRLLKLMFRRYQRELYAERVAHIKALMPHACIGVDVIVGFPTETDEDFLETYQFLNELDISYLHVFTYSERNNTKATELTPAVPAQKRNERSKMLHILSDKKRRFFYEQHVGKDFTVLFENDVENGFMHGFTENYIRVRAKYDPVLINELKQVRLASLTADMIGEVEEKY